MNNMNKGSFMKEEEGIQKEIKGNMKNKKHKKNSMKK